MPSSVFTLEMSIHSNVYNIVQVLSEDGDLHVPWFQRDYTWDEDNINELFEDIFEEYSWINIVNSARNKTPIRDYFLGAVMLCGPSDKRRMILDGQQRLTTLSMIIACLVKRMSLYPELSKLAKEGMSVLINANNEYRLQLKNGNNDTDHKIYTQIMESLESADDLPLEINQFNPVSIQLSKKQIYLTFKHISEKIDQQLADADNFNYPKHQALERLYGILTKHLMVISVRTDDEDYAIKFFETLNARGEDLLSDDLIKNALFLEAQRANPQSVVEKWNTFTSEISEPNARIDFLRFYWNSRFEYISKSRLFKSYKSHFRAFNPQRLAGEINDFCNDLVFSANFYKEISKVKGNDDLFCGLNGLGSKITRPLLLAVNHKYRLESPDTIDANIYKFVRLIESVMMRCVICDQLFSSLEHGFSQAAKLVSNHLSMDVNTLIRDVKELLKISTYKVPTDSEFKNKLNNTVLGQGDLNKSKWRVFFATLECFSANPSHIVIPRKPQIKLSVILQGEAQYHKSLGNIRVDLLRGAPPLGAQTINPPRDQTIPGVWNAQTIQTQKQRIIEKALECWNLN